MLEAGKKVGVLVGALTAAKTLLVGTFTKGTQDYITDKCCPVGALPKSAQKKMAEAISEKKRKVPAAGSSADAGVGTSATAPVVVADDDAARAAADGSNKPEYPEAPKKRFKHLRLSRQPAA